MTTPTKPGKVYGLIPEVMKDIGAIGKTQTNKFDDYKFRGIDDLLKALHPALVKHGLFIVPHLDACEVQQTKTSGGKNTMAARVEITYTIYADDGSSVSGKAVGEGWERGDKAVAIATSTAMKIFCFQFFCIPTDAAIDSENESPQVGEPPTSQPQAEPSTAPPTMVSADEAARLEVMAQNYEMCDLGKALKHFKVKAATELSQAQAATIAKRFQELADEEDAGVSQ